MLEYKYMLTLCTRAAYISPRVMDSRDGQQGSRVGGSYLAGVRVAVFFSTYQGVNNFSSRDLRRI